MGIIIDICIIVLLLIFILIGYKRGLANSIFKIISFVLAIILTLILYKPVSQAIINKTNINGTLKASIIEKFNHPEESEEETGTEKNILDSMKEKVKDATEETKTKVVEESATEISNRVVEIGIGILLFFAIRIILLVVAAVLSFITKLPVIEQFDKLGGFIYGLIEGVIILNVIFAIFSLAHTFEFMELFNDAIQTSVLGSFLFENNIILSLFMK